MEIITIDGMVENDFRLSIEDMLRLDQVDEAVERLRTLLRSTDGLGEILPARFLEVTSRDLEFGGWHRLEDRLLDHGRSNFPITAIGVTLADARQLGGPGPDGGKLSPFIKTFYFSDEAYPFSEASRDDLLDGYSREGFELQGDYRATDATLSVKGIDDLYGAIAELEGRLFDSADPAEDEIRAGAIGSCFLAALIHQALRDTIRDKGLPRPLCVFAACDGVYPFFDAPVTGSDDCAVAKAAPAVPDDELTGETGGESGDASRSSAEEEGEVVETLPGEGSLLTLFSRKEARAPVLVLDTHDAEEAFRFSEAAAAQRMGVENHLPVRELPIDSPLAEPVEAALPANGLPWGDCEALDRAGDAAELPTIALAGRPVPDDEPAPHGLPQDEIAPAFAHRVDDTSITNDLTEEAPDELADRLDEQVAAPDEVLFEPLAAPLSHSLRARIIVAQPAARDSLASRILALLGRFGLLFRR